MPWCYLFVFQYIMCVWSCKYTVFLLNKWSFLSLFNVLISNIFVMQTGTNKSKIESMKIFRAVQFIMSKVNTSGFGLLVIALFLTLGQLNAQGWVKKIGGSGLDQAEDLLTTRDGGYVLLGFTQTNDGDRVFLTRTDIDGTELWSKTYGTANVHGYNMIQLEDGSLFIVGDRKASAQSASNIYLLKVSQKGDVLWQKDLESEGNQTALEVIAVEEGGYLLVGFTDATTTSEDDILLTRLDNDGNILWSKTFGQLNSDDRGHGVVEVSDGYIFTGFTENGEGSDNDIITIKVDKQGELLWERLIATPQAEEANSIAATADDGIVIAGYQGNNSDILITKYHINGDSLWTSIRDNEGLGDQASQIRQMEDGNFLLTGFTEMTAANIDAFVAIVEPDGEYQSLETFGPVETSDQAVGVSVTQDGGFLIAATSLPLTTLIEDVLLFKTDERLNTLTNKIEGEILFDEDAVGCETFGDAEVAHPRWIVVAEQGNAKFFGTTDEDGKFDIDVSTGDYILTAVPTSSTWNLCTNDQVVSFGQEHDALANVIFSTIVAEEEIADLRIDISAPFVIEGNLAIYDVRIFNEGTQSSDQTQTTIEVQLDEELRYVKSRGLAPTLTESDTANGRLLYFLEPIAIGDFYHFQILAQAKERGDDMMPRQAVSVSAMASSPNNLEFERQDDVQVEIENIGGNIRANIRNVGINPITKPISAIVIQDDIAFLKVPVETGNGLEPTQTAPVADISGEAGFVPNGQTLRVIATVEGNGLQGFGSQAIEPIGRDEDNEYMTGFVSMFPEDDQERNFVIDVLENISPARDFEIRGYPKGYRDSLIAPNTNLTYTIYFRNTGTDTINRVVVRDTLSDLLDPATVIPGASNLPYKFELDGNGILKFTFDEEVNLLPGSSAQIDSSSYGYVKFVVSQKPDLPLGSVIHNRAAVFFDYQSPDVTNEVTHVIGEFPDFIEFQPLTNIDEPFMEGVEINIYPNPLINGATFELKGKEFGEVVLTIFDLDGRLVESYRHLGNKFMYYRNHQLPSGMYLYRLESEGQLINSGKLLVR